MTKKKIIGSFLSFMKSTHPRSLKVNKNILGSFLIKGGSILLTMLLVPLTLDYLNDIKFGIWITLSSIVSWFSLFDFGLGHGFKNYFAKALANNDIKLARQYVSTIYIVLMIIIAIVLVLFFIVNSFINWAIVLNTSLEYNQELSRLAFFVFLFFGMRFVFQLISIILTADQRPALSELIKLIGNIFAFITIYILTKVSSGDIVLLGIAITFAPVFTLFIANVWFFKTQYKDYTPSFKYFNKKLVASLSNLGVKFFLIQISSIVMYQSSNVIISQLFGPSEVTPYNIAHRYFSVIIIAFGIITNPYWSAYTEAFEKKELSWIKNNTRKLLIIWLIFQVVIIIMTVYSNTFFYFWVGDKVIVDNSISFFMALYVSLLTFGSIFVTFLNGIGDIKKQFQYSLIGAVAFIPLAIIFSTYFDFGVAGIVMATVIANFYGPFIAPLQYFRIIKKNMVLL